MSEMATLVRNTCRTRSAGKDASTFGCSPPPPHTSSAPWRWSRPFSRSQKPKPQSIANGW